MTPHPIRRLWRAPTLLLAVLALVASACGSSSSDKASSSAVASTAAAGSGPTATPDLSGVTLRVGDQAKLVQSLLEAAGQADTPFKIDWSSFTSGPPLLEALNADAIDIGGVGDAPPVFSAAAGAKISVVLGSRTAETNQGIIVKADSGITTVAELKGRKVAVVKGSSANWVLLKALQDNGLQVGDVDIAYLQPTDAQQAFANNSVDAWVIWDPFASVAQSQGGKLILSGDQIGIPGYTFLVSSPKTLANSGKEAAIRELIRRYRVAQNWQITHKAEWAKTYAELTKLSEDLAAKVLAVDPQPVAIDASLVAAQQAEADAFHAAGLIPTKVDFSTVVDDRFNDVAVPK